MPTVEREGTALAYERRGPADAETVVFIEGLGYGRWMWNWQADALDDEYDVLLPDNRGTGDSDAPEGPYSIESMAADLDAVLDDAGVDEAHVVGASMGGMIAQRYALEFDRASSLALFCTSPGGDLAVPTPAETQRRMFDVPEGADERETIRHRMAPALSEGFAEENPALIERIVDWRLASDAPAHAREAQAAAVAAFDAADELDGLTLPAHVLHGTADRVLPVENGKRLADRLPDAELELIEDGPHLFFVETPDRVTERLRRFLADV
jgi:pimeloyl-ACP methyl ester carboxylesterase